MVDRSARFERERQQGIRDEHGGVIDGIEIIDFVTGYDDAKHRRPFPEDPSLSYELGRTRAQEDMEQDQAVIDYLAAEEARRDAAMRDMLKDHPEHLADWEAKIAEIRNRPRG